MNDYAELEFNRGGKTVTARLDSDGWHSKQDRQLEELLNTLNPYPDPDIESRGYEPNPLQAVASKAAQEWGATITVNPEIERKPGVIY